MTEHLCPRFHANKIQNTSVKRDIVVTVFILSRDHNAVCEVNYHCELSGKHVNSGSLMSEFYQLMPAVCVCLQNEMLQRSDQTISFQARAL
jgi:hypothetical protein